MTTTTNIKLSTPAHGANVDIWDADPINDNSAILDALFGSTTTKSLTNAPVTLSATEAQVSVIRLTGTLSGNVALNVGAIRKAWIFDNSTIAGAFVITVTGGSGNVIGLPPGISTAYWDGGNVKGGGLGRIGTYWDYGGVGVPAWVSACSTPPALYCDGSTFNASTYPQLNEILGGNTLPDARGGTRFAVNDGTARLITAGGIDGNTRFARGGIGTGLLIGQTNLPAVNFNLSISDTRVMRSILNYYAQAGTPFGLVGGGIVGLADRATINMASPESGGIGGTAASGGSATALASVPPGYVGGITMIWAL